jgi:hypothetical protein
MGPSQNEQKEEKRDDDCNVNVLTKEIESWNDFEYSLREENRLLFDKMLSECRENEDDIKAACSKDEYFSVEALFMALILQQQNMINELIGKVSEWEKVLNETYNNGC